MKCAHCGSKLEPGHRFCGECGKAPEAGAATATAAAEAPEAVARYREAVQAFLADGALEDWEAAELAELRAELGVREETHEKLVAECGPSSRPGASVTLAVDAAAMKHFEAGAQCVVRFRVANGSRRALKSVRVALRTSASGASAPGLLEAQTRVLGPGRDDVLTLSLRPELAGQHELRGFVLAADMAGAESAFELRPVAFRVGRPDEGTRNTTVHIDASGLKVGTFDHMNLGGRGEPAGGLLNEGDWHPVALTPVAAAEALAWAKGAAAGAGAGAAAGAAAVGVGVGVGVVDPRGGNGFAMLKEALAGAAPGAKIALRAGTYRGALVLDRAVELFAEQGAPAGSVVLESDGEFCVQARARGVVLRGLVLRAGEGARAAAEVRPGAGLTLEQCELSAAHGRGLSAQGDGAEARARGCRALDAQGAAAEALSGARCVLEDCELSSRGATAVLARGGSRLELARCKVKGARRSGVRLEDAHATLEGCELVGHGINGLEAQGAGRVTMRKCRASENGECGVLVISAALVALEDSELSGNARAGAGVAGGGRVELRGSRSRANGTHGVHVHEGSALAENCDLTGNREGAWLVSPGCVVEGRGNQT